MNIGKVSSSIHPNKGTEMLGHQRKSPKNSQESDNKEIRDHLEIGNNSDKITTYEKPQRSLLKTELDMEDIKNLEEQANQAFASLREIVRSMLVQQSNSDNRPINIEMDINININIKITSSVVEDQESPDYWGAKETAARIVNFAKNTTDNDPAKIELMRNAFKEGFAEAETALGGSLPQISHDTYDEVMRLFKEWESNS